MIFWLKNKNDGNFLFILGHLKLIYVKGNFHHIMEFGAGALKIGSPRQMSTLPIGEDRSDLTART